MGTNTLWGNRRLNMEGLGAGGWGLEKYVMGEKNIGFDCILPSIKP